MNRFILHTDPSEAVKLLCDQHVVKMPLEEAQMLSAAVHYFRPDRATECYKLTHKNHPCSVWARETRTNYRYALEMFKALLSEYTHRYGKQHASGRLLPIFESIVDSIPDGPMTRHPQCMPTPYHKSEFWPVVAYRDYYKHDKSSMARYSKNRKKPRWL